jgi:CelD/BcsL family acetyltransferase involved in cellulose biosynthesis
LSVEIIPVRDERAAPWAWPDATAGPDLRQVGPAAAVLPFARFRDEAALLHAWQRLEVAAAMPMQSLGFAAALADTFSAGADIRVFSIGHGGDLVGLLPLCRAPGRFARWTMLGAVETGEPGDALCLDPEAAGLLARAIVRDGRALELHRVPAGSPLIPAVKAALRGRGWVSIRPAGPMPTIALDAAWRDPAAQFNAGRRSDFRRAARRAGELGAVSFEVRRPAPDAFDALFDEAVAVEALSWKREAGTAIAVNRAKEECFRRFFRWGAAQGAFRIAFMRIDGAAVAMQMALEWDGRYWLFKIGFDETYARCSPGSLLMLHSIGWAAKQGLIAYELLGNIEPWIATFWTQDRHDCVRLRAYPYNAKGAAAFAGDALGWLGTRLAPGKS